MTSKTRHNKQSKRRRGSHPKWPFIVAGAAILIGILWKKDLETTGSVPLDCKIVMAKSAIGGSTSEDTGWGMFTLRDVKKYDATSFGEIVIPLPDLLVEHADSYHLILDRYAWGGRNGGGLFESDGSVHSIMPGIGSLANGHPDLVNVASTLPKIDNAGISRRESPGAGASSHYHDVTWRAKRRFSAGDEVLVDYGTSYDKKIPYQSIMAAPKRSVQYLRETGMCLDNIEPKLSPIPHAGRGAFATRNLAMGAVIAPAPLLVIPDKNALATRRIVTDPVTNTKFELKGQQLMLNYCFGHANSSLLFLPYSPVVNFINHNATNYNAELQWSQSPTLHSQGKEWLNWSIDRVKSMATQRTGLLLEIVATRDIHANEEVLLDYGDEWQQAWDEYRSTWKPSNDKNYMYPTEVEATHQYWPLHNESLADNIEMTCMYHYGERASEVSSLAMEWKRTPLSTSTVRPCRILSKHQEGEETFYTVEMLNLSPQLSSDQIPPEKMPHIVTSIPQSAIGARDKPYHSDQHLPTAFRHAIGIPSSIFPRQWMDLE